VTEDDAARLRDSVNDLPTRDSVSTDAGPPPALELAGDADPGQMASQEAELDRTMAQARIQGAQDAAAPMGEDRILPRRAEGPATLRATVPAGGGAAAGGAGAGGGAPPEAAAIVAREQSGAELAAAARTAQTDMASRQSEHRTRVAAEKAKTDGEIAGLEGAAATAQAGEQQRAQGEVQGLRGEWSTAQTEAVEQRTGEAETARAEGDTAVADARTTGEGEAAGHIETGESEAAEARAEGESEAQAQKARAKEESSGVFGWLASKAKAFFDGIKKGIQKAFEKARAAVKAAIEKAKKLAVAAIEKARSAIVAAIRKVGDALIAIGDKLLADFPALRDRFRKAIQEKVAAAEAAVNRIADGLKEGVQKALDALGGALDAALGLLEKGLLAVVDAYSAAVQGVLKAAQAVAAAGGMFAALIKDVAAGPGQWIANLASGVMDGIKNHLWTALKNAVKNWFNQKVEEVLGLGTALWGVLTRGGIALAEIGKMAWEALKSAIPPTLIQLLIEKLVSMVVPAAGAVMAIIEGLQAAWGTVSRIIAAFGAFFAFLKAVKPGAAGPPFAAALAAGAVVVIDFVANWLLRRLRKPAGKVAGKLKAIGKKILAKLKKAAKKVGRKLKAAARKIGRKLKAAGRKIKQKLSRKKKGAKGKGKDKSKKKSKEQERRERLDRAVRELRPRLRSMLGRGVPGVLLRARLAVWRVSYRLRRLALVGSGRSRTVQAANSAPVSVVEGFTPAEQEILRIIREESDRLSAARATPQRGQSVLASGKGTERSPYDLRDQGSPTHSFVAFAENRPTPGLWSTEHFLVGRHRGGDIGATRVQFFGGHAGGGARGPAGEKIGTFENAAGLLRESAGGSSSRAAGILSDIISTGRTGASLSKESANLFGAAALMVGEEGMRARQSPLEIAERLGAVSKDRRRSLERGLGAAGGAPGGATTSDRLLRESLGMPQRDRPPTQREVEQAAREGRPAPGRQPGPQAPAQPSAQQREAAAGRGRAELDALGFRVLAEIRAKGNIYILTEDMLRDVRVRVQRAFNERFQ
jgi:hypothetical protein